MDADSISCYRGAKSAQSGPFDLKYADWHSRELLALGSQEIQVDADVKASIRQEMWRNLAAEYDAVNLCAYLRKRDGFSAYFRHFEDLWLRDELNHYDGLLFIYHKLYGESEESIHHKVTAREADFSRIDHLINSEFTALVCLAYDELASVRGYADAFTLYDGFGVNEISSWIRRVARDEMFHSMNAQRILLTNHRESLQDVPLVLKEILEFDTDPSNKYSATFLFDHDEEGEHNPFSSEFLQECAIDICKYLRLRWPFAEQSHGFVR